MERPEVLLTLTVACLFFQGRRQFACCIAVVLGYCGFLVFVSTLTITAEVKETLQSLEPAFENLLRTANLYEDVNALSTRLDGGRPGEVRQRHIRGRSRRQLRAQEGAGEAKERLEPKVDAVARAHGEPITMLTCDCVFLMNK